MGKVHQLSQHVANCIAAGEVVENPASVAKELCENAVDAGASEITVSMRGGGIAELVISDDGCGMSREDAQLCFARHATSKIRSEEDLGGITTLGFRGEALAAISAVSRVTLETCERGAECGTRVVREYGETLAVEDAVIAPGTTFAVRELFRNTPARMKFLRSDSAEGAAVASVVGRLALSHPEVRFTMLRDTKRAFETSGSGDLFQAITDFCGKEFARGLLRLDAAGEGELSVPRVWGYVTSPAAHRATRGMQYFFLNGRAVQSKAVAAALDDAYHGLIPGGRFPGCVLHLALAPELCDINVHPTKLTVKFTRERDVYLAVRRAVRDLLERTQTRPVFDLASPAPETEPPASKPEKEPVPPAPGTPLSSPMPSAPEAAAEERPVQTRIFAPPVWVPPSSGAGFAPVMTFVPDAETAAGVPPASSMPPASTAHELPLAEEAPPPPDDRDAPPASSVTPAPEMPPDAPETATVPEKVPEFRVVGMLFDTYIVAETADEAVFIDFHAAHERLRYDRLLREYRAGGVASQTLLSSVILAVSREEYEAVCAHADELSRMGVDAESFGEDGIAVRALPAGTVPDDAAALLAELAREWRRGAPSPVEDRLHLIACHGAKRAGDSLTPPERETLARRVLSDPTLKSCPHGRPVAVTMSRRDFIRNFGR